MTWSHDRDIRAEVIRWLAADPEANRRVDPVGVKVFGARVVGGLDLSHIHVPFPVALAQCSIPERINLDSTSIPFFDLAGSQTGEIYGPNLAVEGNLYIGIDNNPFGITCIQGEVYLRGAKIGGSAIFNAGHFSHSKVEPMSWGSEWKRAIDLYGVDVKGDVGLAFGFEADGAVILDRATMNSLHLVGGHFINPNNFALSAISASVARDVVAVPVPKGFAFVEGMPFEADGEVDFISTHVGTNFQFEGARFRGKPGERHGLIAEGIVVGGAFV